VTATVIRMAAEQIVERNVPIVEEFRSNQGRIGGPFDGHTMLLLHNRGRRTGAHNVNPVAYLPDSDDPATVYVFASAGGRPHHPQWYRNLIAAGQAEVEIGTDRFPVTVHEVTGAERDRIYALQVERMPGFGEYERRLAGVRTIPVVALRRAGGQDTVAPVRTNS
jgi:deazaflavin-dependent oxidoreductase (nitroreductase family)